MAAKVMLTALLTGSALLACGQATRLAVPAGVRLPADSAATRLLLKALNGLLSAPEQAGEHSPHVAQTAAPADLALLDELRDLEKSRPPLPNTIYTYQLLNAVALDSATYLLQLASSGRAGDTPVLRATIDLLAHRTAHGFTLASPLRANSQAWRSTRLGSCTFRYQASLSRPAARAYARQVAFFDKKLQAPAWQTELFCCDNLPAALRLLGVAYKADYNGYVHNSLSARGQQQQLLVLYAEGPLARFDPHDLWHQRLRNVLPASSINKPVDEGCAFLYGGSWGISWPVILRQFQAYAQAHPGQDWLALYDTAASVSTGAQRPLLVRYVLNALLVQQLERTQGFGAVQQLLSCGTYAPPNERYFQTLEQVAGITKSNFNARIAQLIRDSRP